MPTTSTTSTLTDVADLLGAYRTCELTTLGRDGTPFTWPTVAVHDAERGVLTLTTSIGLPVKAFNIRRDPRVALLFSDPTGSGLEAPATVLVQGTATCPDVLAMDPVPLADYWRTLFTRQPPMKLPKWAEQRFLAWYYLRLVITVTPTAVTVGPPAPTGDRLGGRVQGGTEAWRRTARELRRYRSAVLTWVDADGAPSSERVRPEVEARTGGFRVTPSGAVEEGRASLLAHGHDAVLGGLTSVLAVGQVQATPDGPVFVPDRHVPGASVSPRQALRLVRRARKDAAAYLARRGWETPDVPWEAYDELAGQAAELARRPVLSRDRQVAGSSSRGED